MTFRLTTELDAPPDIVWSLLQRPDTLEHISAPVLRFVPQQPLPETWEDGDYDVKVYLGGVLPLGHQQIRVCRAVNGDVRTIHDDGRGSIASRWDHRIRVEPASGGKTRYTDDVDVSAGLLTPLVRLFVSLLYRHRQRRWRALARAHRDTESMREASRT